MTSSLCLSAWYIFGNYQFWAAYLTDETYAPGSSVGFAGDRGAIIHHITAGHCADRRCAICAARALNRLRHSLGKPAVKALVCSVLAAPLLVLIGYSTSLSPAFRALLPVDPSALKSASTLAIHLAEQIAFYAAWEFHFRGFLQQALKNTSGLATAICVQTLVSTLAHFGKPAPEVFGAIIGGLIWAPLAWHTRSLLAGIFQHWLLGASLDYFIFRSTAV